MDQSLMSNSQPRLPLREHENVRATGNSTAGTAMAVPQFRPDMVIFQCKDIYHTLKLLNSKETNLN